MIDYSSENIDVGKISQDIISQTVSSLKDKRPELGFIDVDTTTDTQKIKDFVRSVEGDFENIIIFGMGGSALGAKALLEAAHGKYYNEQKNKTGKNIYILDNIDPETISDVENIIDIKKTLFCFISKSGTTIEPISQYLYFKNLVQKKYNTSFPLEGKDARRVDRGLWKKHFCFVVGENCEMRTDLERDFSVFLIPENIGGRFSVLTSVGLLPLAFSGVHIDAYFAGITEVREDFLSEDISKNIALQTAFIQTELYKQGVDCSVLFSYSSRLFQFGEWYKQLLAESIGKNGQGITPISSIGASDQHSELQLYQDGPRNKCFTFISLKNSLTNPVPDSENQKLSFKKILDIYQYGTETSLKNENHPVQKLILSDLTEKTLGKLLYLYMFQTAYIGELMGLNAFDQPGVEKSKNFARQKMKQDFGEVDLFERAFGDI